MIDGRLYQVWARDLDGSYSLSKCFDCPDKAVTWAAKWVGQGARIVEVETLIAL